MQIGNSELDKIYSDYYIPAIKAANIDPIRIDKDNEGGLLKKEIVEYIEKSEIIIADLTNERPNCYLEVGYAMGLDKYKNIIITVKEDHFPESPNYKKGGHKIHFDLSGYDILFWDPDKLNEFKTKLTDKINRRLSIINPKSMTIEKPLWEESWLENQRAHARENFIKINSTRQMEALISPLTYDLNIPQTELLDIADNSQIQTFGWPVAIVFKNTSELKPIPKTDGIISEVNGTIFGSSYDFTYFKKNGHIFISKSIFEDRNFPNSILPDVRVKRTTELLMYVSRFYTRCKLPENGKIKIIIKYTGLLNNNINFANRGVPSPITKVSNENESISEIITTISEIETRLPELVNELLDGLFVLFDFYKPTFDYIKSIVDNFVIETNRVQR